VDGPDPVLEAFADVAAALLGDFDLAETLDRLLGHCLAACGAAGAGLVLQDGNHVLRDIAYSDDQVRLLERRQVATGEGPCVDCVALGCPVLADDLASAHTRWPRFVPAATEAGFAGVRAVPLRCHGRVVGALTLFGRDPQPDEAMWPAQAFADLAMLAVLQHARPPEGAVEHIARAIHDRSAIERAKGMLAQDAATTPDCAFRLLRTHAARSGHGLTALACALVNGRVTTADVIATP
jgi:GAF domain-containing protein